MSPNVDPERLLEVMDRTVNTRSFAGSALDPGRWQTLWDAFSRGPSAANTQPWEVYVVPPGERRLQLVSATRDQFLSPSSRGAQKTLLDAPAVVVVAVDRRRAEARLGPRGRDVGMQDAFAAVQNLRLMATALGLATLCVREFDPEEIKAVCGLPWFHEPVAIVAVGESRTEPDIPPRLRPERFLHHLEDEPCGPGPGPDQPPLEPPAPSDQDGQERGTDTAAPDALTPLSAFFRARRSVRAFTQEPVPEETLQELLRCAVSAATGGNMQPWEFVVVKDEYTRSALVNATYTGYSVAQPEPQAWILQAPVIIVTCADIVRTVARYGEDDAPMAFLDCAAAIGNLLLAAAHLGLGGCWVGGFRPQEVSRVLGLPSHVKPVALVPVGYPARIPDPKPRLPLEYVCHRDRYGNPLWAPRGKPYGGGAGR